MNTGADITAISAKTCERIKAVVNKDTTVARLANGRLQSANTTNVKIDLGDETFNTEVMVLDDLSRECLLGNDILNYSKDLNAIMNLMRYKLLLITKNTAQTQTEQIERRNSFTSSTDATNTRPQTPPNANFRPQGHANTNMNQQTDAYNQPEFNMIETFRHRGQVISSSQTISTTIKAAVQKN